ncbi:MAG TPA: UDP-N-acetylmuramoyl-tripeptide--D-alanyl-D-alanine ligase [Bryobacteraceae bacterium]|nr:UDP-N-acetylmuramoyl-tripeptide--D-alanyl-D-alanine ligase [Bryobacteraceae bacterium]
MKLALRTIAKWVDAPVESDAIVTGWSVDSRTIQPGDLFFALRGPNFDGHNYVRDALSNGAVAAVVDRDVAADGVVLRVDDALGALHEIAAKARANWAGDVIAVTGSAGKTTTKDIIAELLASGIRIAKSEGNLNNHVGLPLSILRTDDAARALVCEIGMNHAGEIRELARIARPNVGVVTNVGPAHIEFFESVEGIAAAKRELIESLDEKGVAVLNADDPRVAKFAETHRGRSILYGLSPQADVRARDIEASPEGTSFRVENILFTTALQGRHNVLNILAGIVSADLYGIERERLVPVVQKLAPGRMRGERFVHGGVLIFNDCYNSNPDAARAMIAVLAGTPARKRIAVLGEMLELGQWAEPLHRDVGTYVAEQGVDVLVGIRGAACCMLDAATRAGLRAGAAFFFEQPDDAGRLLRTIAQPGDAILFKGSRGVHVERALAEFMAAERSAP